MKILTAWLRAYLPTIPVSDRQLADDLTLRGIAVEGVHDLGSEAKDASLGHLFEMDITTNRVDAMNHYGIAREAATIYNLVLAPLTRDLDLPALAHDLPAAAPAPTPFSVRITPEAQGLCGRFTARVLRDVRVAPSTGRVAEFFGMLGQKSISNAVDASNFTLLGMGHPTHAFDLDKIEGGIVVRLARRGEVLQLLDGTTRTLEADDLVIADERKALSLAGVMGGMESSITAATRNILVESAWFDPATIRRSSRRHLLHTDASHRFERGADFSAAPVANDLVAKLILESGGGMVVGELVDVVDAAVRARTAARPPVSLRVDEVRRHLGTTVEDRAGVSALTPELIRQYLGALGCGLEAAEEGSSSVALPSSFSVDLPSWRLDLEREVDLIEEVARVFGYNRFANTLPAPLPVRARPSAAAERAVRSRLLALGLTESISSTFASSADAATFGAAAGAMDATEKDGAARYPVAMENPLSEEASLLRPSLVPGMLTAIAGNLHRDVREVRLFEQGHTFAAVVPADADVIGDVVETTSLALGVTTAGPRPTALVSAEDASLAGLFALPGGSASLRFTTAGLPSWIEPGRGGAALLHGAPFAVFGELARAEAVRRKLRQPVYLASIAIAELLKLPLREHTAHELSRFQAVERDFSFLFPDRIEWHTVAAAIEALALPEMERLAPVEIFRDAKGKAIPLGEHSLLLRVTFQSVNRTLTEADLSDASARIIAALTDLGGTHRA